MSEISEKKKEEEKDLKIVTALGFGFAFVGFLMVFVTLVMAKSKPRTPGIMLVILSVFHLSEARKKKGSMKDAVKGLFSEKAPELTYENAKKEMKKFLESEEKKEDVV